jgi:hypothetical protein
MRVLVRTLYFHVGIAHGVTTDRRGGEEDTRILLHVFSFLYEVYEN